MSFNQHEKSFYLKAFQGTTLAVTVANKSDLNPQSIASFKTAITELSSHGCRVLLFWQKCKVTKEFWQDISSLFSKQNVNPIIYHKKGERKLLPQPLWQEGSAVIPIEIDSDNDDFYLDEVVRLVIAWRIKRLVLTQQQGGVNYLDGQLLSYVNNNKLKNILQDQPKEKTVLLNSVQHLLNRGVGGVTICRLQDVAQELFTYEGCGTFFSKEHYCRVRSLEIDDYAQVAALIRQGEAEGYLLPRSDSELSEILLSGYGAFIADNHVAGVCCLVNESYESDNTGEIVTLYALTRFQGEGIGVQIIEHVVQEARKLGLKSIFSCTTRGRVVSFFERNGFYQVDQSQIPPAKWASYSEKRRQNLVCLRLDVEQ
ncbi:MAG: GNAT family N-acetyltransferase [Magnetococcales bacterium]|nr:GNAT family N-acetyltransferase [Magnetococcales bacterium]